MTTITEAQVDAAVEDYVHAVNVDAGMPPSDLIDAFRWTFKGLLELADVTEWLRLEYEKPKKGNPLPKLSKGYLGRRPMRPGVAEHIYSLDDALKVLYYEAGEWEDAADRVIQRLAVQVRQLGGDPKADA